MTMTKNKGCNIFTFCIQVAVSGSILPNINFFQVFLSKVVQKNKILMGKMRDVVVVVVIAVDVVIVVVVFVVSGVLSFLLFSSVRSFVRSFVARVIFAFDKF